MKISNRILAIVMAIVLMFSAMPATILAEEAQAHFYFEDTYVYDVMRTEGDFCQIKVPVVVTDGNGGVNDEYVQTLNLNGTTETPSGTVTCTDDQRTAAWEVGGTYPVTYNGDRTFNVTVLPNPITYMDMRDCFVFFNQELGKYEIAPYTTFQYVNEGELSVPVHQAVWLNADEYFSTDFGFSYEFAVDYVPEVSMSEWVPGNTYAVTATVATFTDTFNVTPVEVESIYVGAKQSVEGDNLYSNQDFDENGEPILWYAYDADPSEIVISFKDGTTLSGDREQIFEQTGIWPEYTTDQSYDNQWGVGEHTATLSFMNVSTTYTYTVLENPIASIYVEPLRIIEDLNPNLDGYWNGSEYIEYPWHQYAIEGEYLTVYYKDGTSASGTPQEICEQTGFWPHFEADQNPPANWGVGEHTATVRFLGFVANYTVIIEENPISHIYVSPIEVMEKTYGETITDEIVDGDGNATEVSWFRYNISPEQVTVYYKNGTSISGEPWDISNQTGIEHRFTTDQTYQNQWGIGEHTATFSFGGINVPVSVTVTENPIASIVIDPILLTEKINGYITYDRYWHDLENYTDYYYFQYYVEPPHITINYKDGTSISGTQQEIEEMTGIRPSCYSEEAQNYQNQWEVGDHTCIIDFNGVRSTYTVTVQPCPIEKITVSPVLRTEQVDAIHNSEYWDEETETTVQASWISYDYEPETITIHYKDGTTLSGTQYEIEERTGITPICNSDQSYHNQWGVGTHTATLTYGGFEVQYPVTILECPIDRIEVAPLTLVEGIDGNLESGYWDENNNYIEESWFYYYAEPTEITVYFKDGRPTITGDRHEINMRYGIWLDVNTDQSFETPWGLGTHTATLTYGGIRVDFPVTVVENPIKGISVAPVRCIVNLNGWPEYYDNYGNYIEEGWFRYETTPFEITILYSDGTSFTGTQDQIYQETGYWPNFEDDQSSENQWGLGAHTAFVTLGGLRVEYAVEVIENPIRRIEIQPFTRLELFDGEIMDGSWDEETDSFVEHPWFHYNIEPEEITVYFNDGSQITGNLEELCNHIGTWPRFEHDQAYNHQWSVGEHSATLSWGEASVTYSITVLENNISHITVDNAECYENEDGYLEEAGYWNEFGEFIVTDTWYCYDNYAPATITVHYEDGTSTPYNTDEIGNFTGYWSYCMSDQSYENQWGVGDHTAYLCYGGYKTAFTVTVKEFVMTDDHEHTYRDDCDATCVCGYTRTAPHSFSDANDITCDNCGEMKYGMDFVYTLLKHIDGLDVGLTDEEADFSGDGKVTVFDAVRLLQIINNTPIE